MTWDEAVKQHVNMWRAKEASVPRSMISVCTYDDYPRPSKLVVGQHSCSFDKMTSSRESLKL